MGDAKNGDLVQIHLIVLEPGERLANLPGSTGKVPYEAWIKGFLIEDSADLGSRVRISSLTGRELEGTLAAVLPTYDHNFGAPCPELLPIGPELSAHLESWRGKADG